MPLPAAITGGEVSDDKGYNLVMQTEAPPAKVLLADRGYDADYIRNAINRRGSTPVIPGRKIGKVPILIDDYIYALRN